MGMVGSAKDKYCDWRKAMREIAREVRAKRALLEDLNWSRDWIICNAKHLANGAIDAGRSYVSLDEGIFLVRADIEHLRASRRPYNLLCAPCVILKKVLRWLNRSVKKFERFLGSIEPDSVHPLVSSQILYFGIPNYAPRKEEFYIGQNPQN